MVKELLKIKRDSTTTSAVAGLSIIINSCKRAKRAGLIEDSSDHVGGKL